MRDISDKFETARTALAEAVLHLPEVIRERMASGALPKGDPFPIAKTAAILAVKNTSSIIPYCHPVPVDFVDVQFETKEQKIFVRVSVKSIAKTGVEMEALTGAAAAALTLYDMLKPISSDMTIEGIKLVEKRGGKSTFSDKPPEGLKAAVLVFSDSVSEGKKEDKAGKFACAFLKEWGIDVSHYEILPDEKQKIQSAVKLFCDEKHADMVVTSGGTGASPRDVTTESVLPLLDKHLVGMEEAMRAYGQKRTPYAALSRSVCGVRKNTLIIALPGSSRGVKESLQFLFPWLFHVYSPMKMKRHD